MTWRRRAADLLPFFVSLAVIAAVLEFVFLRLLLRGGGFAPAGEALDRLFALLRTGGLASLTAALLASGVALALVAYLLWRTRGPARVLATLLGLLLLATLLLSVLQRPVVHLAYQLLAMAALGALLYLRRGWRTWDLAAACVLVAAVGTTYYLQASLALASLGVSLPLPNTVFRYGEGLAVAAPLLLLPGRRWRPRLLPLALLPAAAFLLAAQSAMLPLVAAWTLYFTLFLPAPLYAAALAAFVYDLGDLLQEAPRWMGLGLLLLALGGRVFQTTYLVQLSLLGLLLFLLPAHLLAARAPERTPAADRAPVAPWRPEPGRPLHGFSPPR